MITLAEIINIALGGIPLLVLAGPFILGQLGSLRKEMKEWRAEWKQEQKEHNQKWEEEMKEFKTEMKEELKEFKTEMKESRQRTDQIMALLMNNAGLSYPAKKEEK